MAQLIDRQAGLSYVMDMEDLYREVLEAYIEEADTIKARMEDAFQTQDYAAYRIQVHALKSTSQNIGAAKLSEAAKCLEYACKRLQGEETPGYAAEGVEADDEAARERAYIAANHPALLTLFADTLAEANALLLA